MEKWFPFLDILRLLMGKDRYRAEAVAESGNLKICS